MQVLSSILSFITSMGATVMLPIIIIIFGLLFRQKLSTCVKSGLLVGVGFAGINLVIGYFWGAVAPAGEALAGNSNFSLTIMDAGWPATAAIAWGSLLAPLIALAIIVLNLIMIKFNWTKTMNVDIWNFWGAILIGQMAYVQTNNAIIGVVCGTIAMVPILILADKTQKMMYEYYKIPGVSIPHIFTQSIGLIAYPINWLLDRIPGVKDINWNPTNLRKKIGIFGEPMVLGLIIGVALALIARQPFQTVVTTGLGLGATMVLLPKMVSILMEGIAPIATGVQEYMSKKYADKELYIGLDSAVVLGDPANLTAAVILIPVALLIAAILPGNKVLPMADLPTLVYMMVVASALTKGNIFRTVIIGIPTIMVILWVATAMAPDVTTMAQAVGYPIPDGALTITSFCTGSFWLPYVIKEGIVKLFMLF
ncbi:MAG: PTS galactitol transporter subunit IIC [Mogibacterium sp.]|nr:PTS galactitol transporter subunit IIC [Mogibacterium sp.]